MGASSLEGASSKESTALLLEQCPCAKPGDIAHKQLSMDNVHAQGPGAMPMVISHGHLLKDNAYAQGPGAMPMGIAQCPWALRMGERG